jgi:5'-nucleotidase/UDP-sugar diphosphatase
MKRIYWMVPAALALCVAPFAVSGAMASARNRSQHSFIEAIDVDAPAASEATIGRATADFPNARSDRSETAWGRLVADALRSTAKADIAIVNAGTLERGTLQAGNVSRDDIAALLSFGDDSVATIQISGAQLHQALERAVGAYSTGSPAWLHLSGATATFDANAKSGGRIKSLRVGGREVRDSDSFSVAMPVGLAEGGSGYYKVWSKAAVNDLGVTLTQAVANYVRAHHEISPDNTARISG